MYGGSKEYVSKVIAMGRDYFGDRFKPLTEFMPSTAYVELLTSGRVLVLNHHRQQGLGNAFIMLALKKKIFIRGDVSSFTYFKDLGIKVHDTISLLSGEASLFNDDHMVAEKNSEIIFQEASESNLTELWANVFNADLH